MNNVQKINESLAVIQGLKRDVSSLPLPALVKRLLTEEIMAAYKSIVELEDKLNVQLKVWEGKRVQKTDEYEAEASK